MLPSDGAPREQSPGGSGAPALPPASPGSLDSSPTGRSSWSMNGKALFYPSLTSQTHSAPPGASLCQSLAELSFWTFPLWVRLPLQGGRSLWDLRAPYSPGHRLCFQGAAWGGHLPWAPLPRALLNQCPCAPWPAGWLGRAGLAFWQVYEVPSSLPGSLPRRKLQERCGPLLLR